MGGAGGGGAFLMGGAPAQRRAHTCPEGRCVALIGRRVLAPLFMPPAPGDSGVRRVCRVVFVARGSAGAALQDSVGRSAG